MHLRFKEFICSINRDRLNGISAIICKCLYNHKMINMEEVWNKIFQYNRRYLTGFMDMNNYWYFSNISISSNREKYKLKDLLISNISHKM